MRQTTLARITNGMLSLLLVLSLCLGSGLADADEQVRFGEVVKDMKERADKEAQNKAALEQLARAPLTEAQQKLLQSQLKSGGMVEAGLSTAPYLAYLKEQVGKDYPDFPAYVAAMPTPKRKTAVLFAFKDAFPPETSAKELQIFVGYYFKVRRLIAEKGFAVLDTDEHGELRRHHLAKPYSEFIQKELKGISVPLFLKKMMQAAMIPDNLAAMHTKVYQRAWRERLEKHGASEGLLRCAIATPTEFALMRSFFEDTTAFEKWILESAEDAATEENAESQ